MRIDSIYCDFVCGIDGKTVGKPFACAGCQEQRTWVFTPWELRGDSFAVKSPCSAPGSQHHLEFCLTRQSSVKSVFLLTRCSRPVPGSSLRRSEGVASESVCPPPALAALASTPKPRHRHCLGGQTLTWLLSLDSLGLDGGAASRRGLPATLCVITTAILYNAHMTLSPTRQLPSSGFSDAIATVETALAIRIKTREVLTGAPRPAPALPCPPPRPFLTGFPLIHRTRRTYFRLGAP